VQDCADTRNYPTDLASNLLAKGLGADGQEGSICTTSFSSSAMPAPGKGASNTLCLFLFQQLL
jgi:hypothetical protein